MGFPIQRESDNNAAGLPDVLQRKVPNVFTNWSKLGPNLQFFWP